MKVSNWFRGRVRINESIEGERVYNGYRELGMVAGPERSIENLFHEMGHLVCCNEKHLLDIAWGLEIKSIVSVSGIDYPEPRTSQAARNEMKVIATQRLISKSVGIKTNVASFANAVYRFVPGAFYLKYDYGICKRKGDEITSVIGYDQAEELVIHLMVAEIIAMSEAMDIDEIKAEWDRRVDIVTDRLEKA